MAGFIMKKLIPEGQEADSETVRSAVGAFAGGIGIAANLVLFFGKLLAGMLSGSVGVVADALNNLSDASGSILTLVGFRLAGKPADAHHPFGHARFEYLSSLAVSVMILVMGLELGKSAVQKILFPMPVEFSLLTALILAASVAVKLWLWRLNTRLGNRIRSGTLLAAGLDSRNDCIATLTVLAAGLLEHFLDLRLDGIMGLGVAVFILYSGWNLAKETVSPLLGENADPQLRQRIVDYVQAQPKVLGYHDLMVHDYGPGRQYASLHVEMDCREDPLLCHEIIDRMEWECEKNLGVRMVIHYDPVITDDPELTSLRNQVNELLYLRDYRLRQHDLRVVPGRSHRNLVFDVALPSDLRGQEEQIRLEIEEALNRNEFGTYHVRITYDICDA